MRNWVYFRLKYKRFAVISLILNHLDLLLLLVIPGVYFLEKGFKPIILFFISFLRFVKIRFKLTMKVLRVFLNLPLLLLNSQLLQFHILFVNNLLKSFINRSLMLLGEDFLCFLVELERFH